jgi:hypothetical protein
VERKKERAVKWTDTQIWEELEKKQGEKEGAVQTFLNGFLPTIEKILTSGGTSPNDFTLHDAGHAFRVAKRMGDIVGDLLSKLSVYDLALLLLSAYLHDIGMIPEEGKVNNHYKYLLTGKEEGISEDEIEALCRWLDDEEKGIAAPITSKAVKGEDIEIASELITYYCRYRHNDWSGEWIRKNQPNDDLSDYKGFRHDLIKLCQSHHYGRKELEASDFNPRIVTQQGDVVHLRYLACILRIADILEFDPERTPDVILRHRDIAEESLIYWHKDHDIAFAMEGNRLVMSARPTNAIIHKAIEDTCDQIDNELQLCRMLADSTHFETCPGLKEKLPHEWTLVTTVYRDLKPRDNAYEYIDGAFRPNTQKILEMLSGIELYGEALTSVRELLQNAFDAVREQMAYERLKKPCPSDKKLAETLGKLHRVELRLEKRGEEFWLVCSDTGVGMNKRIICNHLLISGQPRRHDILSLERKCREAGFNLGRTGKFGIGVLSYFMISDRLVISTRRSLEPKDGDPNGWIFETRGVGAFGELRRDYTIDRGSRVELRILRESVGDDIKDWYVKLREYLVSLLKFLPCKFQLNSAIPECDPLDIQPGWKDDLDEIKDDVVNGFKYDVHQKSIDKELLPQDVRNEQIARVDRIKEVSKKIGQHLKWICEEGELPDGIGRFRIRIPYFELAGGLSLAFLDDEKYMEEIKVKKLLKGYYYKPKFKTNISWKGMSTNSGNVKFPFRRYLYSKIAFLDLDFHDEEAGIPQVSRNRFIFKPKGKQSLVWLNRKGKKLIEKFVKENTTSRYSHLNCRIVDVSASIKDAQWPGIVDKKTGYRKLQSIEFPATTSLPWKYSSLPGKLQYRGKSVTVLSSMGTEDDRYHHQGISGIGLNSCPDKIVLVRMIYAFSVASLWEKSPYDKGVRTTRFARKVSFPPKWKSVTGILFEGESIAIWNKSFPLLKNMMEDDMKWAIEQTHNIDPLTISNVLLKDRCRAIAWVLNFACTSNKDIWNALPERDPDFLKALYRFVFDLSDRTRIFPPIVLWIENIPYSRLRVLSPNGWNEYKNGLKSGCLGRYMPDPGESWTLVSVEEKPERLKRDRVAEIARRHRKRKALKKKGPKINMAKKVKRKRKVKR